QIGEALLLDQPPNGHDLSRALARRFKKELVEIEAVINPLDVGRQRAVGLAEIIEMVVTYRYHPRCIVELLPQVVRLDAFVEDILGTGGKTIAHACEAGAQPCHRGGVAGEGGVQVVDSFHTYLAGELQGLVDIPGLGMAQCTQRGPQVWHHLAGLFQGTPEMVGGQGRCRQGLGEQALRRQVQVADWSADPRDQVLKVPVDGRPQGKDFDGQARPLVSEYFADYKGFGVTRIPLYHEADPNLVRRQHVGGPLRWVDGRWRGRDRLTLLRPSVIDGT